MRRPLVRRALGCVLSCAVVPLAAHAEEPVPAPAPVPPPFAEDSNAAPPADVDKPAAPPEPAPAEVTIAGTKLSRMPGSAHVITRRQLERMEYDDAEAVVRQVPGVYLRQEDGIGLRPNIGIRGANPDRSKKITLMEDGILFGPAPYSAPAAYYFPLMTRMTAVRVVKGPSAVAYGPQTVGGAVNFVSRPIPERPTGYLDVAGGQYGYAKLHAYVGGSNEQLGFLLEGVHLHDGGFKELPNGGDTGSTRNDLMTKVSYVVDPTASELHQFGFKLSYADETSNETYVGLTDADFRVDPYQRYAASALDQMKNHRIAFVASHRFEVPASSLTVKTDAYRHDYARIWRKLNHFEGTDDIASVLRDPTDPVNAGYLSVLKGESDTATRGETLLIGPNDRTFVSEGIQQVVSLGADSGPVSQRLEFGFRLHHDEIDRLHTESPFSMIGGELVPQDAPVRVTASNVASSEALALHVIDAVTIGGLTVTPGARVEIIRSSVEDRVTGTTTGALVRALMPGLGLYYGLTEALGVLAGVHRGFSPPPPGSSEATKPEYSVNYEGGARYTDGPLRGELIGFYNDYSNLTDICTYASGCDESDLDRQFDAGRAHIMGLEAYAAHDVRLTKTLKLPFTAAYTLTRARFEETFSSQDPIYGNVEAGDEMPYVPRHQFATTVGVEHARAGGAVSVSYVSPMREVAGSESMTEALVTDEQILVDLSASMKIFRFLSLYANLRNVFGGEFIVSRRPDGARPNAPRWLQLGAKLSF